MNDRSSSESNRSSNGGSDGGGVIDHPEAARRVITEAWATHAAQRPAMQQLLGSLEALL